MIIVVHNAWSGQKVEEHRKSNRKKSLLGSLWGIVSDVLLWTSAGLVWNLHLLPKQNASIWNAV